MPVDPEDLSFYRNEPYQRIRPSGSVRVSFEDSRRFREEVGSTITLKLPGRYMPLPYPRSHVPRSATLDSIRTDIRVMSSSRTPWAMPDSEDNQSTVDMLDVLQKLERRLVESYQTPLHSYKDLQEENVKRQLDDVGRASLWALEQYRDSHTDRRERDLTRERLYELISQVLENLKNAPGDTLKEDNFWPLPEFDEGASDVVMRYYDQHNTHSIQQTPGAFRSQHFLFPPVLRGDLLEVIASGSGHKLSLIKAANYIPSEKNAKLEETAATVLSDKHSRKILIEKKPLQGERDRLTGRTYLSLAHWVRVCSGINKDLSQKDALELHELVTDYLNSDEPLVKTALEGLQYAHVERTLDELQWAVQSRMQDWIDKRKDITCDTLYHNGISFSKAQLTSEYLRDTPIDDSTVTEPARLWLDRQIERRGTLDLSQEQEELVRGTATTVLSQLAAVRPDGTTPGQWSMVIRDATEQLRLSLTARMWNEPLSGWESKFSVGIVDEVTDERHRLDDYDNPPTGQSGKYVRIFGHAWPKGDEKLESKFSEQRDSWFVPIPRAPSLTEAEDSV